MKYIPHKYQERATQFILDKHKCALWLDMGLGKTAATLKAVHVLINSIEVKQILIVAPLRVAHNTWPDEIKKWDDFNDLNYCVVSGRPKRREAQTQQRFDIHIINYDLLHWLVETSKRLKRWPWDMIVLDESSQVKNPNTRRTRAIRKVLKYIDRVVELTGTPSPNGLKDLWSQIYLLDQGLRLGKTQTAFRDRWFHYDPIRFTMTPRKFAQQQIQDQVKDITVSMQAKDYLELPPVISNVVPIKLDEQHMSVYQQLEKEMFITLTETDTEVEVFNAAALTNKCLQFSNGAVYTDDEGTWEEIHKQKLRALEDIVEEATGAPVLVCYQYKSDAARILGHFDKARIMDKDPETVHAWNRGEIPILIIHPASAGHGLNLQGGGNILVWFGMTWNLEHYQQANARLYRQGQDKPVFIHHLVTQDTLDETVLTRLEGKRSVQDLLLEAMKYKEMEVAA